MGESCNLLMLPALYPMFGALAAYYIGRKNKKWRDRTVQFIALTHFLGAGLLAKLFNPYNPDYTLKGFGGLDISFELSSLGYMFLMIFSFAWLMTALFSEEYFAHGRNRNRYYFFYLVTLGAVSGVILAADLFTFLLFFEIMSFSSYVWVVHEETKEARRAGATYLAISVIGGLSILMGLFLIYSQTGSLSYRELDNIFQMKYGMEAAVCILIGAGAKAGAFPLHIWLPKAHPVAPAPASALLSGVLTKTGIWITLLVFGRMGFSDTPLDTVILLSGVSTMLIGAALALASIDLKRILACSSISQIGFILIGISLNNSEGSGGAVFHMANHSLLKLVLFMAAGVIYMNIHKLDLNEIQGFGRKKPLLGLIFLAAAAGIAGIPFGNAYFSKSMIHEGIVIRAEELALSGSFFGQDAALLHGTELLFIIAGGFTAAYMAKIYICVFVQKNKEAAKQEEYDKRTSYISRKSSIVLSFCAVILMIIGIGMAYLAPSFYFSEENLKGIGLSLLAGAALYGVFTALPYKLSKRYKRLLPKRIDLEDRLYRPVLMGMLPIVCGTVCRILDRAADYLIVALRKTVYKDSLPTHELAEGNAVTHVIGHLLDEVVEAVNKTIRRKNPVPARWEHRLANLSEMMSENNMLIARSLSFGLILAAIGLLMTLIYLLL